MVVCTDDNGERVTCPCGNEDPDIDWDEEEIHECEVFKLKRNVSEYYCTFLTTCFMNVA